MNLMRWDPFRELDDMSNRWNQLVGRASALRRADEGESLVEWAPAMDVQETAGEYLIKVDLPAVKREDVKVSVENGILAIEGERKVEKEEKDRKFHRLERSYGKFVRQLAVPSDVDAQKVMAEFKDGVLNVHLTKSGVAKPRAIEINVA